MTSRGNITISLGPNESVSIQKPRRDLRMSNYVRYGVNDKGEDLFDVMVNASLGSIRLFHDMKKMRDQESNLVVLPKLESTSQVNHRNSYIRELEGLGLIKRVGCNSIPGKKYPVRTILINPVLLIPRSNEGFSMSMDMWEILGVESDGCRQSNGGDNIREESIKDSLG
jgi:hypothetical protein